MLEYGPEKRIAVVMHGGVSLAIYMGGVAQELLTAINDPAALARLFKQGRVCNLDLDGLRQVDNAGRGAVILEQITRAWALKAKFPFPAFLRYGVLLLAMIGQVAIARSIARTM